MKNILKCGAMRNRIIIWGIFVCFTFNIHVSNAQLIDNKINIYLGCHNGLFYGKSQIQDGSFIFPSFYSNLKYFKGASIKALYKGYENISFGLTLSKSLASDWDYLNDEFYSSSKVEMQSLAPTIQLHNKFSQHVFFNRCKFFLEISPTIGFSAFSTSNELFVIQSADNITAPTASNDFYYGFSGSTGFECALTQDLGVFISYSLQNNRIQSILYNDDHFTVSQLNIGILLKLFKDKRYLYRN